MKKLALCAVAVVFFATLVGCGGSRMNIAGNWTSSEGGAMTISQNGSDIRGTYTMKDGTIVGTLSGNTLNGYWIQSSSGQYCNQPRNNSHYWGIMHLIFTDNSYSGHWGYCDAQPGNAWTGQRR